MTDLRLIDIKDFNYNLPPDRIAQFPLSERDRSKLLVFRNNQFSQSVFRDISSIIEEGSLLVFNETKVVRARLGFKKPSGSEIEIFCLEPLEPAEIQTALLQGGKTIWKCLVGNAKRWKVGSLSKEFQLNNKKYLLSVQKTENFTDGTFAIEFSWEPRELNFSEVLESAGQIPLPPYIHRNPNKEDALHYQTIYARNEGSVAAPTAGLHFTENVLESLKKINCTFEKVTLHIGLGTFKPVTAETIGDHEMHREKIEISIETLEHIRNSLKKPIIAVGTTATRTLESLYWIGCKCIQHPDASFDLDQWEPYESHDSSQIHPSDAIESIICRLKSQGDSFLRAKTQLIIVPGYEFRIISGLITNFHMPRSTLLLLVSALIGEQWKEAYTLAIDHGFRFLSYGDSCLFYKT